jgi:uncharacterized integral membrane protein
MEKGLIMKMKLIIGLILLILLAVLLVQNTQVVTFRLYFWKIAISQIILVPLAVILGFILGFLVAKVSGGEKKP